MPRRILLAAAGGGGSFTLPDVFTAADNLVEDGAAGSIDTGASYKAFPGLTQTDDGNLLLVYRKGTAHVGDNGKICGRISSDSGATWGSEFDIYDPADDARDPSVVTLSDGRVALNCFRYTTGTSTAYQVEVLLSSDNGATWGSPTVASKFYSGNGITYAQAACSGPIVEVSPSLYLLPVYMRNAGGATNWNAFLAKSTDSGATWGSIGLIATGIGNCTEPFITRRPSDRKLICTIRLDDLDRTYSSYSIDDGVTWSAAADAFSGHALKSRMASVYTAHGALFGSVRDWAVADQGLYVTSWDFGATWATLTNLPSPSDVYDYAAIAQLASGRILLVWANAGTISDSDLYYQWFEDTGP